MVHSPNGGINFLNIVAGVLLGDRYISTVYTYNLPRLCTTNANRSNKRKRFHIKKDKKQTISYKNYDTCRQCRWSNALCKSDQAESLLHSLEQAAGVIGVYMNANKTEFMSHLHFKWQASEITRPVHILQQQYLIYWKWCQHAPSKGMNCYWQVINHMEIRSLW